MPRVEAVYSTFSLVTVSRFIYDSATVREHHRIQMSRHGNLSPAQIFALATLLETNSDPCSCPLRSAPLPVRKGSTIVNWTVVSEEHRRKNNFFRALFKRVDKFPDYVSKYRIRL